MTSDDCASFLRACLRILRAYLLASCRGGIPTTSSDHRTLAVSNLRSPSEAFAGRNLLPSFVVNRSPSSCCSFHPSSGSSFLLGAACRGINQVKQEQQLQKLPVLPQVVFLELELLLAQLELVLGSVIQ